MTSLCSSLLSSCIVVAGWLAGSGGLIVYIFICGPNQRVKRSVVVFFILVAG